MEKAIYNGPVYTGSEVLSGKAVLVSKGMVTGIVEEAAIPASYLRHDLQGKNLAPSLIDLQLYGGNGLLFSQDLSVAALEATYEYCRQGGAVHFMITMATNSIEKFRKGMEVARLYQEQGGKGLLGLHLEGPYINPVKRGAHLEHCIKRPVLREVQELLDEGQGIVKMMTLAPECCDGEVIDWLLKQGVLVSAGHSNATYREATAAFNSGIPAATHLFNAMSAFQSREPGMVGAIYDHPGVVSSVVCDGVHVDFAAVRISKRLLQERMFFITDAVTPTAEGEYQHVFKGDRYTLPDGTLSGSSLTMMQCVRNAVQHVGIALDEALRMASLYPARLLPGESGLGIIKKGSHASFLVFDDALNVVETLEN
ncbi:MAG: N-acetylglucosamine-6-phosphate deacetylase [Williamsia sp.]|nr:N-acetylglucosamine-6-phosphate deacetylase [Williamsia sp.]